MAQVVIGADKIQEPSAQLDIISEDKGLLIPRVDLISTSSNLPIADPTESLLVYNRSSNADVTPGFYYWNEKWIRLSTGETVPVPGSSAQQPMIGKDLTAEDTSLEISGGEGATFNEVKVMVRDLGISTGKIANAAVTSDKIADNAVTTKQIQENAVTTEKIAPGGANGQVLVTSINEGGVASVEWQEAARSEEVLTGLTEDKTTGGLTYKDEEGKETSIKSVMPKFFFMPSVVIDLSKTTMNVYQEYRDQFSRPMASSREGTSIPVLGSQELDYHITYYDKEVFGNVAINEDGILTYDVKSDNISEASFMNIVVVVK